jgi:transcriptional regulator with XRE-family HTH domain
MTTEETRLFAYLLEQARSRNMGQNQFARSLGISPATLSAIRHGHKPTLDLVRQIAEALDVPVHDLAELAGILEPTDSQSSELPPEVRQVLRRFAALPDDRQAALLRMWDQMISFAEVQNRD